MNFYVGTSGFNYKHWLGVFYPEHLPQKDWLEFYSRSFETVELNVSFYRLPKRETFETWRKKTPKDFKFSIKGSRYITHVKKLKECRESIELFFDRAYGLGEKLSVVLWQLPPNLHANSDKLRKFLTDLKKISNVRQAFEFRHESWFNQEIYELLEKNGCSLCVAHSELWPTVEIATADFVYLRFHGGETLYGSNYSHEELGEWAALARKWLSEGRDIYAYFNNDAEGFAVQNASEFCELLTGK